MGSRCARRATTLMACAAMLAGCAQIPTSSPVVKGPSRDAGAGPVSIDAQRPKPGAQPQDIAQGFLDAMSSYEFGFPIARTYLAPGVDWSPSTTIVYGAGENLTVQDDGSTVVFKAPQIATIEDTGRYVAAAPTTEITVSLQLERIGAEWRISNPPTWLLISTLERDASYSQFTAYYPSLEGDVLVPDPIWLPATSAELPALLAGQLVNGPTDALGDAVKNAFPPGTRVADVAVEATNARVSLTEQALDAEPAQRSLMAAQLVYTMRQIADVESVSIVVNDSRLDVPNVTGTIPVSAYGLLDPLAIYTDPFGYAVSDGQVVSVNPDTGDLHAVLGPAGAGTMPSRTFAVSLEENTIATVSPDGRVVSTADLTDGATPKVVWNGGDVAQPSWDRYGDLWIAVRQNGTSALWQIQTGDDPKPVSIDAPQLEGTTVRAVRVAPDGVRIAVIIQDVGDTARLLVGRIRRGAQPAITDFAEIAPQVVSVLDVAWLGENDLAVIGSTAGRRGEPLVVAADGSRVQQSVETGTRLIAAFGDQPVLAVTDADDLRRQVSQISWVTVGQANAVSYPG